MATKREVDSPGHGRMGHIDEEVERILEDDGTDIMPGQRAAVVTWASNITSHWSDGITGRVAKPHQPLLPGDHIALAKRQCTERKQATVGLRQPGSVEARSSWEKSSPGEDSSSEYGGFVDMEGLVDTDPGQPDTKAMVNQAPSAPVQLLDQGSLQAARMQPGNLVEEDNSDSTDNPIHGGDLN